MRIIVADDEMHVRKRLAQKIDWEKLGIGDVAMCDDGDEILELMQKESADILLTDIRMARMDGIEAAREARKLLPKLAVILMSAYDDKEYLKSALDLQVIGYLEKPFSIEQAQEVLRKAVQSVRKEQTAVSAVGITRKHQRQRRQALIAAQLCRYQNGYADQEKELRQNFPDFCGADRYYAVLFRTQDGQEEEELFRPDNSGELFWDAMEQGGCTGLCTERRGGRILCILACRGTFLQKAKQPSLKELERLQEILASGPLFCYRVAAVGSAAGSIGEIYRSYQDAVVTMERHFYHRRSVLYFEETNTEPIVFAKEQEDSFLFLLRQNNAEACFAYLERLRKELLEHDSTLVRAVKNHYFQLALLVLGNRKDGDAHSVSEYYLWELFYQMNSLEQLHAFLYDLLSDCFSGNGLSLKRRDQISDILEYIDANLSDPGLSLTEISQKYYMSVTYLCLYFKEKTGTTIRAYIIESRMERAAKLLRLTDMKVSEIAWAVGFADQSYFTKSFGKYFKKSPSRYKEEFREEAF